MGHPPARRPASGPGRRCGHRRARARRLVAAGPAALAAGRRRRGRRGDRGHRRRAARLAACGSSGPGGRLAGACSPRGGPVSRPLPADVHRFRAVVARRLGLQFEDGRLDLLADLLQQRCARWGGGSCTEYLDRLGSEAGWPEELPALATELTVGETYFFRHPDHFAAFAEIALPARQRAREDVHRLRILSAGCASGEETYSLAILLREGAARLGGWKLDLLGIDVNR
ncbi:MAG: hypothetical protein E6J79_06455, partial [Deltaproteobacteria bacterium]